MRKYRKPHRIKKRKLFFRNRFFWLGILILIIFGGFFYLICFSSFFQIKEIKVSGNQKVETPDLEGFLKEKISQRVLFFPTKSIFLVNLNEMIKDILNNFPQVAKAEINRRFPDNINILIIERLGLANWCYKEQCFLLDNEGVIFETAEPGINLIKIISQQNSILPILGEKVIERELLSQILEIESKLKKDLKIETSEILFFSEERLNIKTSEGWEICFNPQKDINWQLTKLKAVLEEGIPLERRKDLEYIELRFGNFASYKYR